MNKTIYFVIFLPQPMTGSQLFNYNETQLNLPIFDLQVCTGSLHYRRFLLQATANSQFASVTIVSILPCDDAVRKCSS